MATQAYLRGSPNPGVLKIFELRARKINSKFTRAGFCQKNKQIKQKMVRMVYIYINLLTQTDVIPYMLKLKMGPRDGLNALGAKSSTRV